MTKPPRIVIADEHEIVREGIIEHIRRSDSAEVVDQASDGYSTIKACRNATPDILLLDLSINRPSGIDTFTRLRSALPDLKIIVCSSEANTPQVFSAMSLGAVGFIPKQATGREFVLAVQSVSLGYVFVPKDYFNDFIGLRQNSVRTGNVYGLSPREVEIAKACTAGVNTKQLAESLKISVRTVETHRNSIYRKTSCHNIAELKAIADHI